MKTVLIIDDEPLMRDTAALMLERDGYKCLSAASADDGVAMMAANQVSVALVDVVLPGKNGLELAIELNQKWPAVPIVLMSGRVSTEADSIKNFSGHFGIKGSISKPFTMEQLLEVVSDAIAE
jgi:DNA-binding response OmpR family regulator